MAENIFLFVPNIIGFGRIFLAIISFFFMPSNHVIAASCYILSGFLDAFDGKAARAFDQGTRFGAMLDMLTDRCGTMCLLVTLAHFYPTFMFAFQMSMFIDISCHWIHVHTTLLSGRLSHKSTEANVNPVLKLYYSSKPILFVMCSGNELFYSMLYLLHFTYGPMIFGMFSLFKLIAFLCGPIAVLKTVLALMQGYYAALTLADIDVEERKKEKEQKQN